MKLLTAALYLRTRRRSVLKDFDRLYNLDPDPFGVEVFPYEQRKINQVLSWFVNRRFDHILDVGCGAGTLTRRLAAHAAKVTAIDFSPHAIKHAKTYTNPSHITYFCEDLVSFPDNLYDLIVCSEILYYLTRLDLEKFIAHVERTQHGCLLMTVGKIEEVVDQVLKQHFKLLERREELNNRRPYAINIYQVFSNIAVTDSAGSSE